MQTAAPGDEPTPQDIARGLAELEAAANTDLVPLAEPEPLVFADGEGDTKRVRKLRAEVAEAHRLAALQGDDTPVLLETRKVRRRRAKVAEAARLHALAQDPRALAYRDQKVRRTITVMAGAAAGIALAVSSIGVQASVAAALGLDREGNALGWWAAFGVEAVLSLPLLAAVGVQAYSAIRGRVVDRRSREGRKLFAVEATLLALTLVLNCWPAFEIPFDPRKLIVHSLGPVAAVIAVLILPTLWKILSDLPVPLFGPRGTGRGTSGNVQDQHPSGSPLGPPYSITSEEIEIAEKAAQIRRLIEAGALPADVGVKRIRETLRTRTDTARKVRRRLDDWIGGDL